MRRIRYILPLVLLVACAITQPGTPTQSTQIGITAEPSGISPAISPQMQSTNAGLTTPSLQQTITSTIISTRMEPTRTASLTPKPAQRDLVFVTDQAIYSVDPNGEHYSSVPIPSGWSWKGFSPSREWALFKEGTDGPETLYLMHLPDGETTIVYSPRKNADRENEFLCEYIWAPDSSYLAFTSKIESGAEKEYQLTADLFIYFVNDKNVNRLTNDEQDTYGIVISPDAKSILYQSSSKIPNSDSYLVTWNITKSGNKVNQGIKTIAIKEVFNAGVFAAHYWLDSNRLLFSRVCTDNSMCKGLSILNLQALEISDIYDKFFSYCWVEDTSCWSLDFRNLILLANGDDPYWRIGEKLNPGWYLINLSDLSKSIYLPEAFQSTYQSTYYFSNPNFNFLASSKLGVEVISPLGKLKHISELADAKFEQSVDGSFVIYNKNVFSIFSKNLELLKTQVGSIRGVAWNYEDKVMYYLSDTCSVNRISLVTLESKILFGEPLSQCNLLPADGWNDYLVWN